jgi:DNA-directed RNA polymerase omega subunit
MFKISMEKLLKNTGGQYQLLQVAFLRVKQLNSGMLPTVKPMSRKNVTVALQEIAEGKVRIKRPSPTQEEKT